MKKILFSMMVVLLASTVLTSCEKDDFDFSMAALCGGTWHGTAVRIDGEWIDITSYLFRDYQFSIRFYEDGSYYGAGYFGNGHGTYTAKGNIIQTYVDGEKYYKYEVLSLTSSTAELNMISSSGKSSMRIRVSQY